jgi:hypothetical protein
MKKHKPTFEELREKYNYLEWYHCLTRDMWYIQAVNLYGKPGYVEFTHNLAMSDPESVEAYIFALEDYRKIGKSSTRPITDGRYPHVAAPSDRKPKQWWE